MFFPLYLFVSFLFRRSVGPHIGFSLFSSRTVKPINNTNVHSTAQQWSSAGTGDAEKDTSNLLCCSSHRSVCTQSTEWCGRSLLSSLSSPSLSISQLFTSGQKMCLYWLHALTRQSDAVTKTPNLLLEAWAATLKTRRRDAAAAAHVRTLDPLQ